MRPMHIQNNLATPNFYPIREVFLELWSVESVNFGNILSILAVLDTHNCGSFNHRDLSLVSF